MTNTSDAIRGGKQQKIHDALFNLQLVKNGYINYCNCDYVAYHHESQTRNTEDTKKEMAEDFNQTLYPFIKENFEKLKKYIIVTN